MRHVLPLLVLAIVSTSAACATAPSLDTAIILSNTAKHVIEAADQVITPVYVAAAVEARQKAGADNAAYAEAMTPYDVAARTLKEVQQDARIYWLAVSQWQAAEANGGDMVSAMAACLALSVQHLGEAVVSIQHGGPRLYGALSAVAGDLRLMSGGGACTAASKPSGPAPVATPPPTDAQPRASAGTS